MKNPTYEFDGGINDDYFLMQELVLQQPEALTKLHRRYHVVLSHIVLQIVHDAADADDVIQDVFVQLWSRPETYCAAKGTPFGWLVTLSRRRAIDCLRRRDAYRRAAERYEFTFHHGPRGVDAEGSVMREACRGDLRNYLMELMGQLPVAQQAVIQRGFFQGMSQRQIAAAMHLPLGTVKTRMELGLKKLAYAAVPCRKRIE